MFIALEDPYKGIKGPYKVLKEPYRSLKGPQKALCVHTSSFHPGALKEHLALAHHTCRHTMAASVLATMTALLINEAVQKQQDSYQFSPISRFECKGGFMDCDKLTSTSGSEKNRRNSRRNRGHHKRGYKGFLSFA